MATIALAPPPPPPLQAERTIAEAIAGHRAQRDKILARGRSEAAIARQSEAVNAQKFDELMSKLRRIEDDFANFRAKAESRIEAWRTENQRLYAELAQARAKLNATKSLPPKRASPPVAVAPTAERASAPPAANPNANPDRMHPGTTTVTRSSAPPPPPTRKRKPHEKELSVSKLEATAADKVPAATAASLATSQRFAKRTKSARPADSRWRPFTVSRSRSATCVTRSNLDHDDSAAAAGDKRGGRASTGGLFKRTSLSFSRSNRSSRSSDRSRPASGMWGNCF